MLSERDMLHIVSRCSYKQGWSLNLRYDPSRGNAPYLQWVFKAPNVKTNGLEWHHGRKWYLSYFMTESEIVLTVFKAALTCEEHECREHFAYEGAKILNPHISVRALIEVCGREDIREEH